MNYTSKFLEYEKNTQRLVNLIEGHSVALKFFEKANRFGHIPCNYSTIQNAHKILLETQGISKTLLGLQSIAQQMQEAQKIVGSFGDIARTTALLAMNPPLAQQLQEAQKIAGQIPFIARIQTKIPQVEPIFMEATKIATSLRLSSPFMTSALPVAMTSINFSARLDNFPYPEQLKIVDALDSLNLDTDIEIPEDLPEEMQSDYVTLIELLQKFCRENENQLLGILTTVETTVKNFSENDFSNPFTVLVFIYNCIILILNQIKLPKDGGDNNNKD